MSIIYDALKKVELSLRHQHSRPGAPAATAGHLDHRKIVAVFLLVVGGGFLVGHLTLTSGAIPALIHKAFKISPLPHAASTPPAQKSAVPIVPPIGRAIRSGPQGPFVLNGIAASDEESFALINNQIVSVGEVIEGAMVVRIAPDEVVLESKGEMISLRAKR